MAEFAPTTSDPSRSRLLYAMQQRIVTSFTEADWIEFGYFAGCPEIVCNDPVLLASLQAGDPAYRVRIFQILEQILHRVGTEEVVDYLQLPAWLAVNDPALGSQVFLGGPGTPLADLDSIATHQQIPELTRQIARIRSTAATDPEVAIGQAKEMLETVMKFILGKHGQESDIDIIRLVKMTREKLGLDGGGPDTYRNRTLSNLTQLVEGINKLRNLYGTGHGRSQAGETDPAHARLVVDSAAALCVFFLEIDRRQQG